MARSTWRVSMEFRLSEPNCPVTKSESPTNRRPRNEKAIYGVSWELIRFCVVRTNDFVQLAPLHTTCRNWGLESDTVPRVHTPSSSYHLPFRQDICVWLCILWFPKPISHKTNAGDWGTLQVPWILAPALLGSSTTYQCHNVKSVEQTIILW
jgi:hypothetical protein